MFAEYYNDKFDRLHLYSLWLELVSPSDHPAENIVRMLAGGR